MLKNPINKYKPLPAIDIKNRQWPDKTITRAPIWCSVDLRDGNQALAIPMNISEKLKLFELLVEIGFKEIEVGFPSASETEFQFVRHLIEKKLIPDDVSIQVLTQAREHLIRKTFDSIQGSKSAVVHLYNSTSPLQRKVTFRMSKEEIKEIATTGAELIKSLLPQVPETKVTLEYSPESFSDTEVDYALEICEAIIDIWEPTVDNKIILNLPATVEVSTPNVHADQIEWFCGNLRNRETATISLHTHNDRGTGIAATELGLLAGADRVEGTLFGNGERTGNLDLITVGLNLYSSGIHPNLDFSNIEKIRQIYETCTRMTVHERHPYAGDLVFSAFSGSHQDAVKKGMDLRKKEELVEWEVPYLLIDPEDIGRSYEAIIRINSQSGKGGVAYILAREFGLDIPKSMHVEIGNFVSSKADELKRELTTAEIYEMFSDAFIKVETPIKLKSYEMNRVSNSDDLKCNADILFNGVEKTIHGQGNGPINALVNAIKNEGGEDFKLVDYRQHSIGGGSATESAAYIQINKANNTWYGCGVDTSIERASLKALICAFNRSFKA